MKATKQAIWIMSFFVLLSSVLVLPVLAYAEGEQNRDKELLEIWKEHVKSLTEERDAANQKIADLEAQIQQLKSGQAAPAAPAMSDEEKNALLTEKAEAIRKADELSAQVIRLQADLDKQKNAPAPQGNAPEIGQYQKEIMGLRGQLAAMKTELDKRASTAPPAVIATSNIADQQLIANLQAKVSKLSVDNQRVKLLEAEVDKVRSEKRELLTSKRDSLMLVSDLRASVKTMKDENDRLRAMGLIADKTDPEKEELTKQYKTAVDESKAYEEKTKVEMASMKAEVERLNATQGTVQKLQNDNRTLQAAYAQLNATYQAQDQRIKEANARLGGIDKEKDGLRGEIMTLKRDNEVKNKQIQALETRLQANAAQLQNFRNNYQRSLDNLVTNIEAKG